MKIMDLIIKIISNRNRNLNTYKMPLVIPCYCDNFPYSFELEHFCPTIQVVVKTRLHCTLIVILL